MADKIHHMVILAGGVGSRLASLNGNLPKPLVRIGEKPVIQHQLELTAAQGIREVTIFAGHLAEKIIAFVGDGSKFGLKARIIVEKEFLGTAGALLQNLDSLPEHFIVLYGDIMHAVNLRDIARAHFGRGADFTAMAQPTDHPQDSDLLETDGESRITSIHTCPHPADRAFRNLANAALYVVRREALRPWATLGGKQDFIKDIMPELVVRGSRVFAYRSGEYIKDMGTPARLKKVESDWAAGKIGMEKSRRFRAAVFFDRDGTLSVEKGFLRTPEDFELLPGAGPALIALRRAGFRLVVLTNQPVLARGEASEADIAAIHCRLEWDLGKEGAYLDGIYVCPHHPDPGFPGERSELKISCDCRKPAIGLFERACRDLRIDPAGSWMIGDQTRDIEMARRAGLRSILVQTGEAGRDGRYKTAPDYIVGDIAAAAGVILQSKEVRTG